LSQCVKVDTLGRLCNDDLERSYDHFTTTKVYFIEAVYNFYFLIIYKPLSLITSSRTFSMQLGAGTAWFCLFQCTIPFCTLSPDTRWDILSIDFVIELPESSGHDAIMTVVDSVFKRVHFVPTHTMVIAEEAARLFLHYIWKLHGLPKHIISNHGPQFVASFTKGLYRLLGI